MAKYINPPEQRAIYDENLMQYWGFKSAINTAVEEAVEEAVGTAVEETSIKIAKNSIMAGLTNELVRQITGLPLEQIEQLRAELGK
jgi:predicted transposase/invertase (TIGR01784 family)